MDEDAAQPAGSGVEILVIAPRGEIGSPFMQAQFEISRAVREIEADEGPVRVRRADERWNVVRAASEIVRRADQDQRDFRVDFLGWFVAFNHRVRIPVKTRL